MLFRSSFDLYLSSWIGLMNKVGDKSMAVLDQFILFGDSITQGAWDQSKGFALGAELQSAYTRRLDILNRGFSGYNTGHALSILHKILPTPEQARIRFLTIWFGANDANRNPSDGQYVPADRFKENLHAILTHPAVTAHSPNIILMTPPPFEETMLVTTMQEWGNFGESRNALDAKEYAQIVKEVGAETGVAVLDIWGIFMEKAGWKDREGEVLPGRTLAGQSKVLEELLYDGLHLGPDGYELVFDELIKFIKEKWPEYAPYKMPYAVKVDWELEQGEEFWDVKNDK